jgi:integrator complex subunit 11
VGKLVDMCVISHFHLDHVGSLPLFTERWGYQKKVFMTAPTKAILPYTLEDCIKVMKRQQEQGGNKGNWKGRRNFKNAV